MHDEVNIPGVEEHVGVRPSISVEEFITQFDNLEAGRLYTLPYYPSDEEARHIAKLKIEVTVLELSNGEVLIAKGKSKTQTAFTRGELLALRPRKTAHTHTMLPVNPDGLRKLAERVGIRFEDIDQENVAKVGMIIPSPDDLILGSVGAETSEIWNEYGKTTYQTYSLVHENMLGQVLQMTANLYAGKAFMTILVHNELSIEEKLAKMNVLLRSLGLSFEFRPWAQQQSD